VHPSLSVLEVVDCSSRKDGLDDRKRGVVSSPCKIEIEIPCFRIFLLKLSIPGTAVSESTFCAYY